jgi:hypothetical protein
MTLTLVNMSQKRERTRPFRHTRESVYPGGFFPKILLWIPAGVYPVHETGQE